MSQIQPVILGGDIGAYAIGRSFHEAFGVQSICLAPAPTEIITRSEIFRVHPVASSSDADTLAALLEVARANPHAKCVLMANTDFHVDFIIRHREQLEDLYALPFPPADVVTQVSDKVEFARVCESLGIRTPRTVVVPLADPDSGQWQAPILDITFPVVAKTAKGAPYDAVDFPGKRKIYFFTAPEELGQLWADLRGAGFRDDFLVQELIPGDNTAMRSITAYVDSNGEVTLLGSARVLLEDHAPTMVGNPVAMITKVLPELWEDARRFLEATGYRGFANFDVKIDPRDGTAYFFEVNPRIGRNSYYMTAAGHNPMAVMVADLVYGESVSPRTVTREVLYSLVPLQLLKRYISAPLRREVAALARAGRVVDPLRYRADRCVRRRLVVEAQRLNHIRKFARYYPKPTQSSF
ncbi:MAG: carboxylate--amine ligase [Buchananella hordeovulneris]|nr:carboxylate--amine ligase [Buchananella hordeovulneris]